MKRLSIVLLIVIYSTIGLYCASIQPFFLYHDVDFESSIVYGFYADGNPVQNNRVDVVRGLNEINILASYNAKKTISYRVTWTELVNTHFANPATAPDIGKLDYSMKVTGATSESLFDESGPGSIYVDKLTLSYNPNTSWNQKSICLMKMNILPNAGKFGGDYQGTITLEVISTK